MSTAQQEVTEAMVRQLWDDAIREPQDLSGIHERVRSLLDRANSEFPVVNWGLTELHTLTESTAHPPATIIRSHAAWLAELEQYHRDPEGWMRLYFQTLLKDFATWQGKLKSRSLADKLVRSGCITPEDLQF